MELKGFINFPFNFDYTLIPLTKQVKITNIAEEVLKDNVEDKYIKEIVITRFSTFCEVLIRYVDDTYTNPSTPFADIPSYLSGRITEIKVVGYLITDDETPSFTDAVKLCIDNTVNCIFFYRNNSPKDTVTKSLVWVKSDLIKYTRPIQYKQLVLDVKRSATDSQYNYVYLTVLNRYYYVTDAVLTNDYASLTLREDVLMSFSDLIRLQDAFVTRNEFTYDKDLVDNRRTFKNESEFTYTEITNNIFDITTGGTTLGGVDRDLRFVLTVVGYGL